ncbi:MAG: ATP-binding protein, partial [Novosphingobium sp.]
MAGTRLFSVLARQPFHKKLMLFSAIAMVAAVSLSIASLIGTQYKHYRDIADRQYAQLAEVLAGNLGAAVVFDDRATVDSILQSAHAIPKIVWLEVRDPEGRVIVARRAEGLSAEALAGIRQTVVDPDLRGWHNLTASYARRVVPIKVDKAKIAELEIGYHYRSPWSIMREVLPAATVIFFVCMAIGIYVANRLRRLISRPFDRMQSAIQAVRVSGHLDARVELTGDPDFDGLIRSYNAMLGELETRSEELAGARDAAEAANVAKSAFLANMSHELRTPLNAIIGYAEVLREDLENAGLDRSVEDVNWIHLSSHQLLELINGLLDLSKIEAGRMELDAHDFDLAALLGEVEVTLQPLAAKQGNALAVTVDPAIGMVHNDSTKLRQCLLNLGSNACKFTRDGFVDITVRAEGGDLVFEVSDTGIGMSEEELQRLFQPFVQSDSSTTRRYGGTGLGLALIKRFVAMLGGTVEVSSEIGYGTTFTVRLRRHLDDGKGESVQLALPSGGGIHPVRNEARTGLAALIVEDDPSSAELLRRMLERNGYHPILTDNGEEGMAIAARDVPDMILLDIGVPKLDGWSMLERLSQDEVLRAIPTIVISVDDR